MGTDTYWTSTQFGSIALAGKICIKIYYTLSLNCRVAAK
jgi:hypothetical protein